jgi:hypothetical protein
MLSANPLAGLAMNFTDYFFNTPWWLPAAVVAVGAVLFYTANKRQETRLRTAGLLVVFLGVAVAVVSYFVDTDLERAEKQTRRIVDAFENKDWPAFRSLLHPGTSISIANGQTLYRGNDVIANKAREASDKYGFRAVNVTGMDSRQDQTLITVSIGVISTQEATMLRPINSTWEFDWLESADGWYLSEVRAVRIGQATGEGMESMFPKR